MRLSKSIAVALVFAGASAQTAVAQSVAPPKTCDYGEVHENAPPETAQFAFLIGDYKVSFHQWQGESWSPPQPGVSARWNGYYGLGGMAIIDEWYNPDTAQKADGNHGINVRMYDPDAEEWDMMWFATGSRQVLDLRAKIIDDKLTMWQVYPERANSRSEFYVDDADNWHRVSYTKDDNGEWAKQFKLAATRIPCVE